MEPRKTQEWHDGFRQIMKKLQLGHINKDLEGEKPYNNLMKKFLRAI